MGKESGASNRESGRANQRAAQLYPDVSGHHQTQASQSCIRHIILLNEDLTRRATNLLLPQTKECSQSPNKRSTMSSSRVPRTGSRTLVKRTASSSSEDEEVGKAPIKQSRTSSSSSSNQTSNIAENEPEKPPAAAAPKKVVEASSSDQKIVSVALSAPFNQKMSEILEMLECPVCLEYPRTSPSFTCSNGHLICGGCKPGMHRCPTCRDDKLTVCSFVTRLTERALKDVSVSCKFSHHGCQREELLEGLSEHEEGCPYRDAHCPAKHRGACSWYGSLTKMIIHVREHGCIQVNKCSFD